MTKSRANDSSKAFSYLLILPDDVGVDVDAARSVMWPAKPGYLHIRDLVEPLLSRNSGGRDIGMEHVSVLFDGDRRDMFVDEMGHVSRDPQPYNAVATKIYRASALSRRPSTDPDFLPRIVGPAILFLQRVWF